MSQPLQSRGPVSDAGLEVEGLATGEALGEILRQRIEIKGLDLGTTEEAAHPQAGPGRRSPSCPERFGPRAARSDRFSIVISFLSFRRSGVRFEFVLVLVIESRSSTST